MLVDLLPLGVTRYLVGGLLIGAGVSLLFVATGRIGGASSVFTTSCSFVSDRPYFQQERFVRSRGWRLIYAIGMVLGALVVGLFVSGLDSTTIPWWQLLLGGVIAGFGARLGGGCTSGHGICGMASLRPASFVAVGIFLTVAIATAHVVAILRGGA
ncbi:MAG TPA: hypothetical protein ENI87_07365 [bacterium]|nr:hypothetical protein [bacterium]